jgi:hypothetical protein
MLKRLLLILVLMGFAMTVCAQTEQHERTEMEEKELKKRYLYQWTDDKGISHITDGLGKVPETYRENAKRIEQPKKDEVQDGRQVPQKRGYDSRTSNSGRAKAQWQQRMRGAKARLAAAEKRYQVLEQRRNELLRSWGGPASGRRAGPVEAEAVEREMKGVQREIEAAKNERDNVIPEAARKAGIPPGWLRE